jgi:drug/metabolite transporter (DMT)-like permease
LPHGIATHRSTALPASAARPDASAFSAFAGATLLAGGNAIAIRISYAELAPFWGAGVRFLCAALILLVIVAVMRLAWPRGRALAGVLVYGALNFGLTYLFAYWALREVTAGTAMVVLAIVPLLTLVLAVARGIERFRMQGLIGAILAAVGILFIFQATIGSASLAALLALLGGALCIAESNIVIKTFPRVHPAMETALGMAIGGGMLMMASYGFGEAWVIPSDPRTQLSLVYLIILGSIGLFILYLLVLARWTATGASYVLLISPLVTIALGALLIGEPVRSDF